MSKYLFIIESPGKQKKIKSFLGKDFNVIPTYGHIVDLPPKKIGVSFKDNFKPIYEIKSDKKDVVKKIKSAAQKSDIVYIATDLDREGSLIANGVVSILPKNTIYKRVEYGAITKKEILNGIKNAGDVDIDMVNSAECRRILDRIVGWKASFPVTQATGGPSAGRVQSAALRILAEREKEIQSFIPQEYWPIEAELERENGERIVSLIKIPKPLDIKTESMVNKIIEILKKKKWNVSKYDTKEKSNKAYAPFTTSTLYQASSSIMGWGAKKTSSVAQQLYESGLCLLEDELITLSSGEIIQIKDAYKYLDGEVKAFGILGDNSSLKINNAIIKDFQKLKYKGDIYNIRTLDGQEISVTPEHKLLSFDGFKFVWRKAKELKIKDFVICAKNLSCEREEKEINIVDFIFKLPVDIKSKIMVFLGSNNKEKILNIIEENKTGVSLSTYYKYKRNLKIPFIWVDKEDKDIFKENDIYFQWQSAGSKKEKIDVKSFCYFLGLVLGDGHICKNKSEINFPKCIASDDQWRDISKKIIFEQNFNLDKNTIRFSGRILKELCIFYGGKQGYKCDSIYVHSYISSLPEKYIWMFLAGLFDSDGCLKTVSYKSKGLKPNLSYTSISQSMLKQMGVLLRTLGVTSSLHRRKNDNKNGSIKIWENSIHLFLSKIYLHLKIKQKHAEYLIDGIDNNIIISTGRSKNENYPVIDIIEKARIEKEYTKQNLSKHIAGNSSNYWNYTRIAQGHNRKSYIPKDILLKLNEKLDISEIKRIINGDEYFAVVKEIKVKKYNGFVYDISTSSENFIANSFYSHNCTYIRSDSTYIVPDFVQGIRCAIPTKYGDSYLPHNANVFSNKASAQEAHEAIRVTDINIEQVESGDKRRLYEVIWKRTTASQMANLLQFTGSAEFECDEYVFGANGSRVTFDGWKRVWDYGSYSDSVLPEFVIGEELKLIDVKTEQKFTQPPPRYTESSLTKELEKRGIGRPSTYASIPNTLFARGYIEKKKNTIYTTDMGIRVSDFLVDVDFCFVNLDFTKNLEEDLDRIANKEACKLDVLTCFWNRLKSDIENAKKKKEEDSITNFKCPECGGFLLKKHSKYGPFLNCSNRTNKTIQCQYKCDIDKDGNPKEKEEQVIEESSFVCPNCGEKLIKKKSKKNWEYLGCINWNKNEECKGFFDKDTGEKIVFKKKTYKKWKKKKKKK